MPLKSLILLIPLCAFAQTPPVATASRLSQDTELNTDPESSLWKSAPHVTADRDPLGQITPGHKTEIRLRWSPTALYLFYTCPYEKLYLRPELNTRMETNKLWEWDVAEVFIGGDFEKYWQYREYQVSPRAEWVDLDIDTHQPKPEGGWGWNSGYKVAARIDESKKTWFGAMRIPFDSIDARKPVAGLEYRINFYRLQGPPPDRAMISWNPTGKKNYHVPEKFGLLRLEN